MNGLFNSCHANFGCAEEMFVICVFSSVAAKKRKGQDVELTSAANKTLHDNDGDGEMAEVKLPPSKSLAVDKKDKKKKKLERKPSDEEKRLEESLSTAEAPLYAEKKKKKKKSEEESAEEDLFSFGQNDSVVGSFDAVSGRRTMNKKMRELAATVKVVDLPQSRKTKAVSVGLDALLVDDFGTIGEST